MSDLALSKAAVQYVSVRPASPALIQVRTKCGHVFLDENLLISIS